MANNFIIHVLHYDKIIDRSKLKAFVDDKIKFAKMVFFVFDYQSQMHCEKWKKCWLPAFSPFPTLSSKGFLLIVSKSPDWMVKSLISDLTLSQPTYFRLPQTGRVCRGQFWIWWKWQKVLQTGRKHCGKRKNCSLRGISLFPSVFSKSLDCRHVKTKACLGKG